jgi:hypothetical protein
MAAVSPSSFPIATAPSTSNTLFESRVDRIGELMNTEGLSDLSFKVVDDKTVNGAGHPRISVRHAVVDVD